MRPARPRRACGSNARAPYRCLARHDADHALVVTVVRESSVSPREFVVALLSSLHSRVYVALVVAEVSFIYPGLLSVYLMRKSPNLVPDRVIVAPRLLLCSCRGRTHIRVCTACRRGLNDVRLPVDDARVPSLPVYLIYPLHVRAFAPFARVVVVVRVRGRCVPSPSIRALSRKRSAHIS
jgi:hypothetical protein